MNKKDLRKLCLNNRRSLSINTRNNYSQIICEKLLVYLKDKRVMSYYPTVDEVDVSLLNLDVYYPIIEKQGIMHAYKPLNNNFIKNSFGILEPDKSKSILIDKKDIDVIIVPLLGFDNNKNRLGHGGGYYDRYLSDYKGLKIGVGFSIQKLQIIETTKNDIPMDIIISENEIIY